MRRILQFMKKRKTRYKLKVIIRKYIPKSSRLYSFATDYKLCYIRYLKRCDSFFTSFVNLSKPTVNKLLKKSSSHSRRFSVSRMKLMTSGDIELNPGPQLHVNVNTETTVSVGSTILLNFRLHQLGLRPLDVGGAGDCFFRAVSHQLYGDPCHHLHVRQTGIDYLRANPERFIESNTQNSWNEYLSNMSLQGTWCDALIVQAVAESHYLRIHIIESHENFGHTTIVQPVQLLEEPVTSIYLGHVSEVHYVSTVPCMFGSSSSESQQSHRDLNMIEESVVSGNSHISTSKRKRSSCMREYRKRKKVDERRNLPSKGSRPNDASTKCNCSAYMGEYYCKKKEKQ